MNHILEHIIDIWLSPSYVEAQAARDAFAAEPEEGEYGDGERALLAARAAIAKAEGRS